MQSSQPAKYDDLRALFINCTLKVSPRKSHTQTLLDVSQSIMATQGVSLERIRAVDHDLAPGATTFMTWNLLHLARMLKDSGGFPAHGNQVAAWDEGCHFGHPRYRGDPGD